MNIVIYIQYILPSDFCQSCLCKTLQSNKYTYENNVSHTYTQINSRCIKEIISKENRKEYLHDLRLDKKCLGHSTKRNNNYKGKG